MFTRLVAAALAVATAGTPAHAQLGKDSKLLAAFKPVVARPGESTVRVRCDDKDAVLGTVVDADGYILTKASELRGAVWVRLPDGSEYECRTVGVHKETDLALLKVDVKGLKPVQFADTAKLPAGFWLAAPGTSPDPLSVGIVSVATRKLTGRDTDILNPNRGYMGVVPEDATDDDGNPAGARLADVPDGGAAARAGLKPDDVIVEVNGQPVTTQKGLRDLLEGFRGGDVVAVKAKRKGQTRDFKVTLGSAPKDRGDIQNGMGSVLSARRTGFPQVLQTDLVVDAKDCGGPVVDLDGNVLGINIARAGRVETWILPSEVIRPLLPELKAGKFPPTAPTTAPPPAKKPADKKPSIDPQLNDPKKGGD